MMESFMQLRSLDKSSKTVLIGFLLTFSISFSDGYGAALFY